MWANNEVGTLNPIREIGALVARGPLFFSDATQAVGKVAGRRRGRPRRPPVPLGAQDLRPEGRGRALRAPQEPARAPGGADDGGGHERGMRSGTLNVPGHRRASARPASSARTELDAESARCRELRDHLQRASEKELGFVELNGHAEYRLPGNLNLSFHFVEGESLIMGISDIAVSSGSACTSASLEPSHVLRSMDVGEDLAHSSIRFGIGRFTTREEVDYAADAVIKAVRRLREMSPLFELAQEGVDLKTVQWQGNH
jgi:cysteine desulfurase